MEFNPNTQSRKVFRLEGPAQAHHLQGGILAGMDEPSEPLGHPWMHLKHPNLPKTLLPSLFPSPNSNSDILNIKTAQKGKSSK